MTIVTKRKLILAAATVLVATAAVGTLSLAGGATGAATPPTHAHSQARAQARKHRHHFSIASFICSHAERALARVQGAQTDIANGLPRLTHREQVATQRGRPSGPTGSRSGSSAGRIPRSRHS